MLGQTQKFHNLILFHRGEIGQKLCNAVSAL